MRIRQTLVILFLLVSVVFTECHAFSEASLDPNCVNDYDTEMTCYMTAHSSSDCSQYRLNVSLDTDPTGIFTCRFEHIYSSACECKFQVNNFVVGETFSANLLREGNVLLTKDIQTKESIKPKRPIIMSVNLTDHGDFLITWNTNYTSSNVFSEDLSGQLTYSVKGSAHNVSTDILEKGKTTYTIVGRRLQPNSDYIFWARVFTDYNNKFSDYSEPYKFNTPSSLQSILKIVIPISCVILIFFISKIYYCYIKIMREWWDKVPVPKIFPNFEKKQVPYFSSFHNEFSTVHIETSKLDHTGDKAWKSYSNTDVSSEHSHCSLGQDGNLSQVIYAQTGYESVEETDAKCELHKENQAPNLQMPGSHTIQKDLQPNNMGSDTWMKCGNSSGSSFSNRCYLESTSRGSSFRDKPVRHSAQWEKDRKGLLSALSQNLEPLIPTDFEYGPCNVFSGPADTSLTQLPPSSSDITVVLGYQSTDKVLDHGSNPETDASVDQAFINSHTDVNRILEMAFCSRNPQDVTLPACESTIMPVDDGYQALQNVDQNPGDQWSTDHRAELQQSVFQPAAGAACQSRSCQQTHAASLRTSLRGLCHPVLHISPGIQIDCSYQSV